MLNYKFNKFINRNGVCFEMHPDIIKVLHPEVTIYVRADPSCDIIGIKRLRDALDKFLGWKDSRIWTEEKKQEVINQIGPIVATELYPIKASGFWNSLMSLFSDKTTISLVELNNLLDLKQFGQEVKDGTIGLRTENKFRPTAKDYISDMIYLEDNSRKAVRYLLPEQELYKKVLINLKI